MTSESDLRPPIGLCRTTNLYGVAHTKIKYGKELSPRGRECECSQEERSTSITKQLVTLCENETTLFENSPITSALDHINENGYHGA